MSRPMKILTAAVMAAGFVAIVGAPSAQAQEYTPGVGYQAPPVATAAPTAAAYLSAQQIDQLTAPIALYADPVLAQLLPAATYPDDIAAAASWLQANPTPTEDGINAQTWDPSVKAIVHYPTVLQQMAGNMEWTQALGAAFINQQQDVMDSIQRLRAQAQSVGTLQSTPEQQVVADDSNCIEILPAQPDVIFIPQYDPSVCYTQAFPLRFRDHFRIGVWDNFGFDWGHHFVAPGFRWDHFRPGHAVERRPEIATHPWVRDVRRPAPVMPARYAPARAPVPVVRPGYEKPGVVPVRGAFGVGSPAEVEKAAARGRASQPPVVRPAPIRPPVVPPPAVHPVPVRPAPAPHPAPAPVVRPAPEPMVRPAPAPVARPAPEPSFRPAPAPAPAFNPGSGGAVNAQSDRGHQSMHR